MANKKIAIIINGRADSPNLSDSYTVDGKSIDGIPYVPNQIDWADPLEENKAASVKTVQTMIGASPSVVTEEEPIEITALMEIKGYVTLNFDVLDRKYISLEVAGGSIQLNKETLGSKAPGQLPQFEGDNLLKNRVYFKNVPPNDGGEGNEAHTVINGNYTTGTLLLIRYRVS